MSRNTWNVAQRNTLAELVMPGDAELVLAPRLRGRVDLLPALAAGGPAAVARELYSTLCGVGIDYALEPLNWTRQTQLVRTPAEVVFTGQGTCLDLALLFASCLEENRIHPVILVLKGHALAGFWSNCWGDEAPPLGACGDCPEPAVLSPGRVRSLIAGGQLGLVECTGFARSEWPVTLELGLEVEARKRGTLAEAPAVDPPWPGLSFELDGVRLIEFGDAQRLAVRQVSAHEVLFGLCVATARGEEIYPKGNTAANDMQQLGELCGSLLRATRPVTRSGCSRRLARALRRLHDSLVACHAAYDAAPKGPGGHPAAGENADAWKRSVARLIRAMWDLRHVIPVSSPRVADHLNWYIAGEVDCLDVASPRPLDPFSDEDQAKFFHLAQPGNGVPPAVSFDKVIQEFRDFMAAVVPMDMLLDDDDRDPFDGRRAEA
jgi:hypothetical protein